MTRHPQSETLWEDITEGLKWKPILPLLKAVREAPPGPAKLAALRDAAAFFVRTSTGRDPMTVPAFEAFDLVVGLAQSDPRVARMIGRLAGDDESRG